MSDLISRQAAIDAIGKYNFEFPDYMERFVTELRDAMKADLKHDIKALPSAQPEQRWIPFKNEEPPTDGCFGCKHRIIRSVPTSKFYCDLDDAFHDNLTNCPLEQDAPSASEIRGEMFYADMGDDE